MLRGGLAHGELDLVQGVKDLWENGLLHHSITLRRLDGLHILWFNLGGRNGRHQPFHEPGFFQTLGKLCVSAIDKFTL